MNHPSNPSRPPVPIWLRIAVLLAVVGFVWFSRREGDSPPNASPPRDIHPISAENETAPVTVQVIGQNTAPQDAPAEDAPRRPVASAPQKTAVEPPDDSQTSLVITNLKLKDQSGRVIYQGDIDLQPTLDRIAAGELISRFHNDGSTFQNRERKLPRQPAGYYREYVVPTPEERGPGPQRLVVGKEGEVFYTSDHYKNFRRIR